MNETAHLTHGAVRIDEIHTNTSQTIIYVTEDKARIALMKFVSDEEKRSNWHTPLALSMSLGLMFPTSTFKSFGLAAETWAAIFIVLFVVSLAWLGRSIFSRPPKSSVEDLLSKLKNTANDSIR